MSHDDRNDRGLSRRRFLGQASCAAVGTTAMFNSILNMGMINALAAQPPCGSDYRALVCLFLSGGIDSFNLVVPRGPAEHSEYAGVRGDLALPAAELLPIAPATEDGRQYGLHPSVPGLQSLFDEGRLAVVANVGTLAAPTTLQQYRDRSVALPLGLYSHADQAMHWQTALPDRRTPVGWAGRMADILESSNCNEAIAMNISLSGSNVFQSGQGTSHYTIGPDGSIGLRDYGEEGTTPLDAIRTEAIDGLLGIEYQHVFERTFAMRMRNAIDAHLIFSAAIDALPPLTTQFSDNPLSQRLRMVALTIAARDLLGMRRQTFFVELGGWDHHDEVLVNQEAMLPVVSTALAEFDAALRELDVDREVTTFTASDFGRTLSSNGRGSDHAWGGNHLVMGGSVLGGDIYGSFPDLYAGNSLDTGRGRLIPTTSVDELYAEMALWFGVPAADLELVLPNLDRFWSTGSSSPPLGFLAGAGPVGAAPPARLERQAPGRGRRSAARRP